VGIGGLEEIDGNIILKWILRKCNWFLTTPSIATKFQYVNSFLFSFSLTTCFGPYGPSSGEIYNLMKCVWMLRTEFIYLEVFNYINKPYGSLKSLELFG
jgi:hypothetical protein